MKKIAWIFGGILLGALLFGFLSEKKFSSGENFWKEMYALGYRVTIEKSGPFDTLEEVKVFAQKLPVFADANYTPLVIMPVERLRTTERLSFWRGWKYKEVKGFSGQIDFFFKEKELVGIRCHFQKISSEEKFRI